mgnify:CR=1 FL=1
MKQLRGILRISAVLPALLISTIFTLLMAPFPLRIRGGVRLSIYPVIWFAHYFIWIFNIRYACTDPEKLRTHSGLLICNHLSYMDVFALLYTVPAKFMSTVGVKKIPLVGWVAASIDTIFVNRGSKESRAAARIELGAQLQERSFPPLAIFPEGRIGDSTHLLPFRHGAFTVAISQNISCLPCAIRYMPYSSIGWTDKEETLPHAVWRLATADQSLQITIQPLDALEPRDYESAASMAEAAYIRIATALE